MFTPGDVHLWLQSLAPAKTLWLAYSGGVDSHVLLDVCQQLPPSLRHTLQVVHVHHGLHRHADRWAEHCQHVCAAYGLPFRVLHLNLKPKQGHSLEALAREARYQALSACLEPGDYLLTAHHLDDQMETVLLYLLRGSGPRGLAGIAPKRPLGSGYVLRPLLNYSKQALRDYAQKQQLRWVEDDSNDCLDHDRNYIRHKVTPLLQARWPHAGASMHRAAQHCFDLVQLSETYAKQLFERFYDSQKQCLKVDALHELSHTQLCQTLRYFFQYKGYAFPSTAQMSHLIEEVLFSRYDKNPSLKIGNVMARRYLQGLYLVSITESACHHELILSLTLGEPVCLPGDLGVLVMRAVNGKGLRLTEKGHYEVRFRQGGERIRPLHHPCECSLKRLMSAWKIVPWQRSSIPLLFHEGRLIAVVGYCIEHDYAVKTHEVGYELYQASRNEGQSHEFYDKA